MFNEMFSLISIQLNKPVYYAMNDSLEKGLVRLICYQVLNKPFFFGLELKTPIVMYGLKDARWVGFFFFVMNLN